MVIGYEMMISYEEMLVDFHILYATHQHINLSGHLSKNRAAIALSSNGLTQRPLDCKVTLLDRGKRSISPHRSVTLEIVLLA